MSQVVKRYPPNTFAWIDLASSDAEDAKRFYTSLFGWTTLDLPLPMGGTYTMLQQDGKDVAGLSSLMPDQMAAGSPSRWSSYISVEDADAMTEKALAAGATLVAPVFDVMDSGRMSVLQDPGGAVVCLWQPQKHIGAQLVNIPNALVWNELVTREPEKSRAFYTQVFGWDTEVQDDNGSPVPYTNFKNKGRMAAGMMPMTEEWTGVPPHWSIYIAVEDAAATAARAQSLGGSIVTDAFEGGDVGTIAVLRDPQGAVFNVIRMNYADEMP